MWVLRRATCVIFTAALVAQFVHAVSGLAAPPPDTPEARAVAFLSVEVPKWERENHCYSCHNNGDAVRGLAAATRSGLLPDRQPLADTLTFLATPETWDGNGPDGPFKDKKLARIQFAAALAAASRAGLIENRDALQRAAALVAELQMPDGTWPSDAPGTIGSPVTYGRTLATALAMHTLRAARDKKYQPAIDKAVRWFVDTPAENVLEAAAAMDALAGSANADAVTRLRQCWQLIEQGQSSDGGWGPFVNAPPDVFDTALVVVALSRQLDTDKFAAAIARGRAFLIAAQETDGGWPATTRPPGVDSYAQRISTSGWATQALLATRPK